MARIRSIKPEFWQDERIAALPMEARLLFLGLCSHADDEGRLRGNALLIRAMVFPYDPAVDVEKGLTALEHAGRIVRYDANGERFIWICNFTKHQKIDKPKASPLPPPPTSESARHVDDASATNPRRVGDASAMDWNGVEGSGGDGARQVAPPAAPAAAPVDLPPTSSILFFAWTQQARAEAFPGVFPENPPRGYEVWYERALGEVGDEGRLRGAFRAFLRDGWAAKLRPLGTIQAFIGKDNWRKHVPAAEAAPKPKREWVKVTPPEAA